MRLPVVFPRSSELSPNGSNLHSTAPQPGDFENWKWQVRNSIATLPKLESVFELSDSERKGTRAALRSGFPISITPYYASLSSPTDPNCPIRMQCIPRVDETQETLGDLNDPLGEENHEVAPNLIQRYPDRALLIVTDRCSVYCRFCTRSRMVGAGGGTRSIERLEPAFSYLRNHKEIREVIVSGGDALVMATSRIAQLLRALADIKTVDNLRIATRTPVTLPQRINDELCECLTLHPCIWVMTHFNHPKELSPQASFACLKLAKAGIPVMNQTVLLRGVNDDAAVLEQLFRGLVRIRVRPYYLLQTDPVRGTGHFRTPLLKGIELMEALQGRVSGIALPKFVVDTPGGRGKVPLGPRGVVHHDFGTTWLKTFRGETVPYVDPPLYPRDCDKNA